MAYSICYGALTAVVLLCTIFSGLPVDGLECYRCINLNYIFSNDSTLNETEQADLIKEYKVEEDRNPECRIGGNVETYSKMKCLEGSSCSDIHIPKPEVVDFFGTGEMVTVTGDERGCTDRQVPEGCNGPRCYCREDYCNTDEIRILYERTTITCHRCMNLRYEFSADSKLTQEEQDALIEKFKVEEERNPECKIGGDLNTYDEATCSYPKGSCSDIHITKPEVVNFFATGEMVTVTGDERGCTEHPRATGCNGARCFCKGDYCNTDELRNRVERTQIKCHRCIDLRYQFSPYSKLSREEKDAMIKKYKVEEERNPECKTGGDVSTYTEVACSYPEGSCSDIHITKPEVVDFFGTGEMVTVVGDERGCSEHPRNSGCEGPRCYCKGDFCNTDELRQRYEPNSSNTTVTYGVFGLLLQCLFVIMCSNSRH